MRSLNHDCIKKMIMPDLPPGRTHAGGKPAGGFMCIAGNFTQAVRPVPYGIKASHDRQQNLCGTDVRRGFFAPDMLFTRLQRQPVGGLAMDVLRYADKPPRNGALQALVCGKKRRMWPAKAKGYAKSLGATYGDVGAKLAGRGQHGQYQQITRHNRHTTRPMNARNIIGNITDQPAAARIADQCAKTPLW